MVISGAVWRGEELSSPDPRKRRGNYFRKKKISATRTFQMTEGTIAVAFVRSPKMNC